MFIHDGFIFRLQSLIYRCNDFIKCIVLEKNCVGTIVSHSKWKYFFPFLAWKPFVLFFFFSYFYPFPFFLSFLLSFIFISLFAKILHPFFLLFVAISLDEGGKEKDENTEEIMLTIFMYYYQSRLRIGNASYTIDNNVALRIQPVSTRDLCYYFFLFRSFFRRCYFWIPAIVYLH